MKRNDLSEEYKRIFPTFKVGKYEEIFSALEFLGNPHKKIENKVIHITGTNGKGSICSYIKTILETAGYKVGVFTSPHLVKYNERFYFNKRYATNEEIEKCKNEVLEKCKIILTFFKLNTIIAIMLFSNHFNEKNFEQLDFCIFEVNMGGRFDSTNIFQNLIACGITSISFDHMEYIGNSLEKIVYEKGGIIKSKVPCFTTNTKPEINVLQKIADGIGIKLYKLEKDFNLDFTLKPSLSGYHQFENATLAKEICKYIGIDEKYIREGISNT